jgi:hypothetical protein
MILWRPVGLTEMGLVFDSGMRRFPPRLPEQPIFYPVLARSYAADIAGGWNVRDVPHAGYVLKFDLADEYAAGFDVQVVGASVHQELWIPASEVSEVNRQIVGNITVDEAFFGTGFRGETAHWGVLRGKDAIDQIGTLTSMLPESSTDFALEVDGNARAIFLHYPFWTIADRGHLGIEPHALERCLSTLRTVWGLRPRPAALIEKAAVR